MHSLFNPTKGEIVQLHIEGLNSVGEGVGRLQGLATFVPYALPSEDIRARILEVKKTYARAMLVEILKPSAMRVKPPCPFYEACGGCQLQHVSYEGQLQEKRQRVADALQRIGGFQGLEVLPTLPAKLPFRYRNKMQFPLGLGAGGKVLVGCYAKGTHQIIDANTCLIQKKGNDEIAQAMREIAQKLRLPIYNEDKHRGILRHVMGRMGMHGEKMAVIVTATPNLPKGKQIVQMLRARVPGLVSIQQNIQTYHNNVILGRETRLLWGKPVIHDRMGSFVFSISPRSFFQVHTEQAEILYQKALEFANLTGVETVLDAYCGTGTITLFLAKQARKAIGMEIVHSAIADAKKNARENQIKNAEFFVGDAKNLMPRLYHQGLSPDVIVTDPPRAGCDTEVLQVFASMKPLRIIYVSCNPATLARDAKILRDLGYMPTCVQPVDMFPQTSHVETVVRFDKQK